MTNYIAIRTSNISGSDELVLKQMLQKNGAVIMLDKHITTNAPEHIVSMLLTQFYDRVFAENNDSRMDKTIHYRTAEGIWKEVHPFQIVDSDSEDAVDFEEDYQFDLKSCISNSAGFFKSAADYRAQLDQVLVI